MISPHPRSAAPLVRRALILWAGLAAGGLAPPAPGQKGAASITGQVIDHVSGAPIAGATVLLIGTRRATLTDSGGRFGHTGLGPGTYVVQARAIGYAVATWAIRLDAGQAEDRVFEIEGLAYELPPIVAEGEAPSTSHWLREFDRRRALGRGYFLTRRDIEHRRAATLADLLRSVPGVRTVCTGRGCAIRMDRSPRACRPEYYMDGFPATFAAGPSLAAEHIAAVEVYRSLTETPGEFLKLDARCGVIVIWTKTGL